MSAVWAVAVLFAAPGDGGMQPKPPGERSRPSDELERLALLLRERDLVDGEIAALIGHPALRGPVGEWIASRIFGRELAGSATQKGFDGVFTTGPLAGKTANVKWYGRHGEGVLDLNPAPGGIPDHDLVLAGPRAAPGSSGRGPRPWLITEVFLFDGPALFQRLVEGGVQIGPVTSVMNAEWDAAWVYPAAPGAPLTLSAAQRSALELFAVSG